MISYRHLHREISAAAALAVLLVGVAAAAPSFFAAGNLRDLAVNNAPVLVMAIGMTLVILAGQIDISVGSQFAVCSVAAGMLAKSALPMPLVLAGVLLIGTAMGALNGALVGRVRLPSIIVTLAMMVAWRDALRWRTEGAWVQDLPANFQWMGFSQATGEWLIAGVALALAAGFHWALQNVAAGRAIYAVGSDADAARLAGVEPARVTWMVFALMGTLTAAAAFLNAVRFSAVPGNAGAGLELKAIAAVVVGGAAITGGRGTIAGTVIGAALLGTIGTALTFLGINPFWEKAIQGAIILAALASEVALRRFEHARLHSTHGAAR